MKTTSARDYGWAALALVMGALGALQVTGSVLLLVRGQWSVLVGAPVCLLFDYWIGMGAWRRTRWGRRDAHR